MNLLKDQALLTDRLNLLKDQASLTDPLNLLEDQASLTDPLNLLKDQASLTDRLNLLKDQASLTDRLNLLEDQASLTDRLNILKDQASLTDRLNLLKDQASLTDRLNLLKDPASRTDLFEFNVPAPPETNIPVSPVTKDDVFTPHQDNAFWEFYNQLLDFNGRRVEDSSGDLGPDFQISDTPVPDLQLGNGDVKASHTCDVKNYQVDDVYGLKLTQCYGLHQGGTLGQYTLLGFGFCAVFLYFVRDRVYERINVLEPTTKEADADAVDDSVDYNSMETWLSPESETTNTELGFDSFTISRQYAELTLWIGIAFASEFYGASGLQSNSKDTCFAFFSVLHSLVFCVRVALFTKLHFP